MRFVPRPNSTTCLNVAQNTRLRILKKLSNVKPLAHKRLHFIPPRTQIPTGHVLCTTKDVDEKGLRADGSGALRCTT